MDYTEAVNALEQYKNAGNDMNAIIAAAQSLADTGKTPLGLNQWKLTDKPRMEEFNEDNRIIDEQLQELSANKVNIAIFNNALDGKANMPKDIPANADLNEYTTPGMYFTGAKGIGMHNLPTPIASFCLFVERTNASGAGVKQTFTEYSAGDTYIRVKTNPTTWTPWRKIAFSS